MLASVPSSSIEWVAIAGSTVGSIVPLLGSIAPLLVGRSLCHFNSRSIGISLLSLHTSRREN
jgi:hypothetical protein